MKKLRFEEIEIHYKEPRCIGFQRSEYILSVDFSNIFINKTKYGYICKRQIECANFDEKRCLAFIERKKK